MNVPLFGFLLPVVSLCLCGETVDESAAGQIMQAGSLGRGRVAPASASWTASGLLAAVTLLCTTQVMAQSSCQADMERLSKNRLAAVGGLNALAKAGKGKLDPIAACPKLRSLAAIEGEFAAYLVKNKDWCGIPDAVTEAIETSRSKTVKVAAQACNIAVQVKKQQLMAEKQAQQQASSGSLGAFGPEPTTPRLPSGPL